MPIAAYFYQSGEKREYNMDPSFVFQNLSYQSNNLNPRGLKKYCQELEMYG